jgi:hypothetical protein
VNEDPVPPRELDTTIHPGLSAVVQRALSKSPWARFQSCREFAEALQHYQDFDEPRAARSAPVAAPASQHAPAGVLPAISQTKSPMASAAKPALGQTPWATVEEPPKRRGGFALIALLLLAIIGGAGYRVYPALQEIWQRSHAGTNVAVTSLGGPPSDAATSADGNPADKAPADTTTVPAAPTVSSPAAALGSAPSPLATSPQESIPVNAPADASVNASANSANATTPAAAAPVAPATTPIASPIAPSTAQLPAAPKPPVRHKAVAPQPSQLAMEWKDLIEAKLASGNIQGNVSVVAVGNSVILTGRLNPFAHGRLLRQLQFVPQGLQIVDDIEYSDAQATQDPRGNDASAKR